MRILIIETSGSTHQPIFTRLAHLGHRVELANNGDSAAALCRTFDPELVVFAVGDTHDGLTGIAQRLKVARHDAAIVTVGSWSACEHADVNVPGTDELEALIQALGD